MTLQLVTDVHTEINKAFPTINCYFVRGTYEYYHYLCDGFDDRGWGCGYRTLQTICSWMKHNFNSAQNVPSAIEIQKILVELQDKPESFLGSKQWIGSFEVCLVLDKLYDVPSKIIHVNKGDALESIVENLCSHFEKFGSPVMMGGDVDCSSKGVMGVHSDGVNSKLLIVLDGRASLSTVPSLDAIIDYLTTNYDIKWSTHIQDPHYVGKEETKEFLCRKGWVKWKPLKDFLSSSFYNLCLPQVKPWSKDK